MGYLTAILAAIIWGLVYAIRQKTLPYISSTGVMFFNALITLALTVPIILVDRTHITQVAAAKRGDILLIILASAISVLGMWLLFFSITKLGATTAAMIEIAYPLFVALFCWWLLGQSVNWAVAAGGALIFAGSCVIMIFGKP